MGSSAPPWFFNRVYVVSGGASGIGLATVKQLLAEGARVSVGDYRIVDGLAKELGYGGDVLMLTKVDVTDREQVAKWIAGTVQHWGRLDGAANIAGAIPRDHNFGPFVDTDDEDWANVFAVNVNGTKHCVTEELKYIGKGYLDDFKGDRPEVGKGNSLNEPGSIVNCGSTLSIRGSAYTAAYTASKHAVLGLTRSVAIEVGTLGVRVNCVLPGPTATPMMAKVGEQERIMGKQDKGGYGNMPLRRVAEPREIADGFVYLLGDKSTYITGVEIRVDGGLQI